MGLPYFLMFTVIPPIKVSRFFTSSLNPQPPGRLPNNIFSQWSRLITTFSLLQVLPGKDALIWPRDRLPLCLRKTR
jgi:hypothetical protein